MVFTDRAGRAAGFTLVEIMVAVGIMAIFMAIAAPSLYQNMHQDSMRKAVNDVMEACSTARARAILDSRPMDLVIRPAERTFSVSAAAAAPSDSSSGPRTFGFEGEGMVEGGSGLGDRPEYHLGDRMVPHGGSGGAGAAAFSVKLGPSIMVEGLGVNGEDWTEDLEARVRFYPNGTCDEMSIVLLSDKGERRNIFLEVVTGFADFEVDPLKFRAR